MTDARLRDSDAAVGKGAHHFDPGRDSACPPHLQSAREEFIERGFVAIPGLVNQSELTHFDEEITQAVASRKAGYPTKTEDISLYEQQFLQCLCLWEDFPSIAPLTFHQGIGEAAAALLGVPKEGVPKVRLWHDQALFKPPGGLPTTAHQDNPFWPVEPCNTITAWIPLGKEGATTANGCMGYVPGSHTSGLNVSQNIASGDGEEDFRRRDRDVLRHPALGGAEPHFTEVSSGTVVFHHGMTLHCAKANSSGSARRAYTIAYCADGCTRGSPLGLSGVTHFQVDRAGCVVADGAPIDSPATPVAFPLPRSSSALSGNAGETGWGGSAAPQSSSEGGGLQIPPVPPRMERKMAVSMGKGSLPYSDMGPVYSRAIEKAIASKAGPRSSSKM